MIVEEVISFSEDDLFDAGCFYAPYIPLAITQSGPITITLPPLSEGEIISVHCPKSVYNNFIINQTENIDD